MGPAPGRALLRAALLAISMGALLLAMVHCEDQDRCAHDADCPEGNVCSNEKDPRGVGVCVAVCDPHIAAPSCDAGSDASSDARSDAAGGGAGSGGAAGAAGASAGAAGMSGTGGSP
jgi:hypothetical protein